MGRTFWTAWSRPACGQPHTRTPKPETRTQKPETLIPRPYTLHPKPETRIPNTETRNPEPESLKQDGELFLLSLLLSSLELSDTKVYEPQIRALRDVFRMESDLDQLLARGVVAIKRQGRSSSSTQGPSGVIPCSFLEPFVN